MVDGTFLLGQLALWMGWEALESLDKVSAYRDGTTKCQCTRSKGAGTAVLARLGGMVQAACCREGLRQSQLHPSCSLFTHPELRERGGERARGGPVEQPAPPDKGFGGS